MDEPLQDPVSARLPGVRSRPEEDATWGPGVADAEDLQLAAFNGLADRGDGDAWVRLDPRE
jgi:hypothetical protein